MVKNRQKRANVIKVWPLTFLEMLVLLTRLSDHLAKIIPLWGKRTALSAINKNQLNIIGNLAYCRKKCLAATNLPIHA